MSGKKNFAVISSQMDRAGKRAEKTVNVKDSAEVKKKKRKTEETTDSQPLQIPLNDDVYRYPQKSFLITTKVVI